MNLSLLELSKKLNLPESTIDRWIKQGRIPVHKEQGKCIFNKASLIKWAVKHNLKYSDLKKDQKSQNIVQELTLASSMERGEVFYGVNGSDIKSVLEDVVNRIEELQDSRKEDLLSRLIERENLTSTGIGNGIAIPHPRIPIEDFEDAAVFTCFLEKEVDYNAIDNKPVSVLFLLLSPSTKEHLSLLSKLAFCMRDASFVSYLKDKPSKEELTKKVKEFEKRS